MTTNEGVSRLRHLSLPFRRRPPKKRLAGFFPCACIGRTCSSTECRIGTVCEAMRAFGLAADGTPLPRKKRPICGARNRRNAPCTVRVTIRISAPVGFGGHFLTSAVFDFLAAYPKTKVELHLTDETLNLVGNRIDLAFRTGILPDSTLIARKLGSTHRILCASPDYLARRGVPVASADLARHHCVIAGPSTGSAHWVLDGPRGQETVAVSGRFAANEMQAVIAAAIAGYGIAQLPYQVAEAYVRGGRLCRVLGDYTTPVGGLYAVYPSSRHVSPLVKEFTELAAERLAATGTGEDGKAVAVFNQSFG